MSITPSSPTILMSIFVDCYYKRKNLYKKLDSTEEAIEHNLVRTGYENVRAPRIYLESSKTSCFQWLLNLAAWP
ncbi:hypothetical protein IGI04_014475 [Brassica rapa subsp. trilocularis]|uniref:Uncharacterized protein n=1 Tax=Brassica rapa subsp. trilocularis TaxID=1813537 RepID=A0ABQ7MNV3_BRACM|nr:hypothetical protein IGI04_014475 [Brassica rapa subsp. trilocularis]